MRLAPIAKQQTVWGIFQIEPYIGLDRSSGRIVGGGEDLERVFLAQKGIEDDFSIPACRCQESINERFSRLAKEWKEATIFTSSVTRIATDPAYQQIIGMGADAVPLILEELARETDHWFWALHAITGVDPTAAEDAGNVESMAASWLNWGRGQGYLS